VVFTVRLQQSTAATASSAVVSFGDATATSTVSSLSVGVPVNITHTYLVSGTFTVSVTATPPGGLSATVNTMTVVVAPPPSYSGDSFKKAYNKVREIRNAKHSVQS
jgi:hypothetical protein